MAVLTLPPEVDALAGQPIGASALYVRRRGERGVRTIPLLSEKCTIGSGARCHIRLPAADAQPLQCLLSLEAGAATVIRWADGVLLNGRNFTKSPLNDGDRLAIGDWEIGLNGFGAEELDKEETTPQVPEPTAPRPDLASADAKPACGEATRPNETSESTVNRTEAARRSSFGDRVVFELWTANQLARRRLKALVTAWRAERLRASENAVEDRSAEVESLQAAALNKQVQQRSQLASELEAARAELANSSAVATEQAAERDELRAELAVLTAEREQLADALAAASAQETRQSDFDQLVRESSAAQAKAELEAIQLRKDLESRHGEIAQLRQQAASAAAAREFAEGQLREQAQLVDDLSTKLQLREQELLAERERIEAERDELLDKVEALAAAESRAAATAPAINWSSPAPLPAADPYGASAQAAWLEAEEVAVAASATKAPRPVTALPKSEHLIPAARSVHHATDTKPPTPVEAPAASAPTSFIDKYRHLFEEDEGSRSAPVQPANKLLDEEFLSPAKVQTCAAPDDDSDEALEAYMSSMMQRVRGDAGPPASQAIARQLVVAPLQEAATMDEEPVTAAAAEVEPFQPTPRKPAVRTDMSALRAIANASARTAIASHHQRRHYESAVGKMIVALASTAGSAYLMASAPGLESLWFWGGVMAALVGVSSAVQVLRIERRRAAGRRKMAADQPAEIVSAMPLPSTAVPG